MSKFKDQHPFEQRQNEALRVRLRYPNKTPVIVERDASARDDVPDLEKTKFLIPNDYTMGQLMFIVRSHLRNRDQALSPSQTLYFFVNKMIPRVDELVSSVYATHHDADSFLYVTYVVENSYGARNALAD
eukprot:gnl/Spiro4/11085_TR5875_c0_g2_i1.p2 gnl/Spiro4/11085_TR5875_c0_g2~~gnl/Spiro4/11085_TR5875_c0_g2_i1.p2  ORF type:complete len:130 (+),score=50.27 gnl/Spiro4/11085_TR5875_c0_g2_i1:104-493(+)